jgi:hypothetical protein
VGSGNCPDFSLPLHVILGYVFSVAFPQYRIPIQRLKEEWAFRLRMERLRRKRPPRTPSKITDNSEPWIKNPSSVAEFREIACKVNETVAKWGPPQDNSSKS